MGERIDSDDAIRSALGRLKVAVFGVERGEILRPYNAMATQLLQREALREDLMTQRPSHPLALYLRAVLDGSSLPDGAGVLTFPSGAAYRADASQPSRKGRHRLLMLFIEAVAESTPNKRALDAWPFTPRERAVVDQLLTGAKTDEICAALAISTDTLKTHVKNLFAKTGSRTRAELVAKLLSP